MQSVSACLPMPLSAKADDLACRRASIAPPARLHHGANTAAMGVRARQFRTVAVDLPQKPLDAEQVQGSARLLWRADANRNQRRIRSTWHRATGRASFAEELRLIARRAAVSGDQDFIVLALHRAPRNAVRSDHPDARTGRTGRPFITLRTWRTGRTRRTDRTCIALGTLRSGRAWIALRTLAAGG